MDLSLLQGPAATPPAMPPVSSKTIGEGGDEGAFDALLDEAVLDEDGDTAAAPAFVVAPVKEPWIDLVIRGPIAPPTPSGQPGPPAEPAGDAVIPPAPGAGAPAIDDLPLRPTGEVAASGEVKDAQNAKDASTPVVGTGDPAFAAALAAAASQAEGSHPDVSASSDAPQVSADRPAAPEAVDAARVARPEVGSPLPQAAPKPASGTPVRAASGERRAAEQVLQQAMNAAGDAPQAPAPASTATPAEATSAPASKPVVVAAPAGKPEPPAPAPNASAPFAVNPRAAVEAFARQEAQGDASSSRGGAERGFGDHLAGATPAVGQPSTSPVGAVAFAAVVDAPASDAPAEAVDAPAAAESLADVPDLLPQFVKGIQMHWRGALGEARLELQPPHLGPVTVDLLVGPNGVDATLTAESPLVRGWIEAHEGDLRDGLAGQGLQLASLTVTADPQEQRRRQPSREGQSEPERRNADPSPENWQEALTEQGLKG